MTRRKRKRRKVSPFKATLNKNVRWLRVEKKLTRDQLAEASGIAEVTIQFIEQGATKDPKVSTVVKLAKALGVSVGVLLGLEIPE